jgi:hypothetical protein
MEQIIKLAFFFPQDDYPVFTKRVLQGTTLSRSSCFISFFLGVGHKIVSLVSYYISFWIKKILVEDETAQDYIPLVILYSFDDKISLFLFFLYILPSKIFQFILLILLGPNLPMCFCAQTSYITIP